MVMEVVVMISISLDLVMRHVVLLAGGLGLVVVVWWEVDTARVAVDHLQALLS